MKTKLAGLLLCSLMLGGPAAAAVITLNLDDQVSGLSPGGAAPWVTATFTDSAGGVDLSIAAAGLSASEYITRFFFNFNPAQNSALYLGSFPNTGTQTDWNSHGGGNDAWPFGTAGVFDFLFDFPPQGDLFTSGETFHARFIGVSAADFNFASSGGYLAAAEIAGIGTAGAAGLGVVGAAAATVPEPGVLALLGLGLAGLAASRKRKQ